MAGEDHSDALADMWRVTLQSVTRLEANDPSDHDETYMVEIALDSPSANGSIEIMVGGNSNETHMIGQAREILRAALERWARVMASQSSAERGEPARE